MDQDPIQGGSGNTLSHFMLEKSDISTSLYLTNTAAKLYDCIFYELYVLIL